MKYIYITVLSILYNKLNADIAKNNTFNDLEYTLDLSGFISYGNWCGPGHGGYQDCCDNKACQECDLKKGTPTEKCLEQCPPIDELDYYCALHDECCMNNPKDIICLPEGNKCYCDCVLLNGANNVADCTTDECLSYRLRLVKLFNYGLSCWYNDEKNISRCNKVTMRDFPIKDFCVNDKEFL